MKKVISILMIILAFTLFNVQDINAGGLNSTGTKGFVCQYYIPQIKGKYYLTVDNSSYIEDIYIFDNDNIDDESGTNYQRCPGYIYIYNYNADFAPKLTDFFDHYFFSDTYMNFDVFNTMIKEKNNAISITGGVIEDLRQYKYSGYYYGLDSVNTDNIKKAKSVLDSSFSEPLVSHTGCAVLTDAILEKINWFLNIVKYGGTALAVILGMVDFLKAVASDEDNATKKAGGRFAKRLIAAVIIFLTPLFLQFLLNTVKIPGITVDDVTCGIGVTE